jgi:hypothetical protein
VDERLLRAALAQLLFVIQLCFADQAQILAPEAHAGLAAFFNRHFARSLADAAFCRATLDQSFHILIRSLAQGDGLGLSAAAAVGTGHISYHEVAQALTFLTQIHPFRKSSFGIYSLGKEMEH